jgi:hypothetical protein
MPLENLEILSQHALRVLYERFEVLRLLSGFQCERIFNVSKCTFNPESSDWGISPLPQPVLCAAEIGLFDALSVKQLEIL